MRILKMTASFGCLNGRTMEPEKGLHVEILPNESGKSTWAAFLLAMFYGIDSSERASKGKVPAKIKYQPWSGAPMEGTLLLEQDGKKIVLQRTSEKGKPMGNFRAYDPDTGVEVPALTGENCGRQLLGVGREVFRRTAFLSGSELQVTKEEELAGRLANLAVSGSMEENAEAAKQRLKAWSNRLSYHNKGLIPETEAALGAARQKAAEKETMEQQKQELLRQMELLQQSQQRPPEKKNWLIGLLLLPVYLAGAGVFAALKFWLASILMAVAAVCFLGIFVFHYRHNKKVAAAQVLTAQRQDTLQQLQTRLAVLQSRIDDLQPETGAEERERELEEYRFRLEALKLALSVMEQAEAELEKGYGPQLTACAGELLCALTRTRYDAMVIDRDLNLSLRERESGLMRPLAMLSRGTQDQAWLALRLAMTRLLLPKNAPVILDDALLTFDEDRTAAAMDVLAAQGRQVLVFSCREL